MRLLHDLGRDALRSYELLLGSDLPSIHRRGYLIVHLSPLEIESASRSNAIRASLGATVRMIPEADLMEMEPAISGLRAQATFVEKAAHVIDPSAFVIRLAEVFVRRGGILRCERVQSLECQENGEVTVTCARQNYSPGTVVLATGAEVNLRIPR
ncbi:FAD-dependent oxidoreductase [Bradyrhizobium sp. CCBAU 51753]|uniref:FAD-dependent oxidoreductase n=1 Tax=Bradyrhizobium sp. CCBAU 51753 TaxID=1325100 RepID=UPI00188DC306